jgi:hypothetical protein
MFRLCGIVEVKSSLVGMWHGNWEEENRLSRLDTIQYSIGELG